MIKDIIELLEASDFYIGDEDIDLAKGKYESPTNWKELKKHIKRNIKRDGGKDD